MQPLSNDPRSLRPTLSPSGRRAFFPLPLGEGRDGAAVARVRVGRIAMLWIAALAPTPALAQAWTTINATPPASAAYQVAKNDDDIRAGRRSGQLSKAEAGALHRENARVGALAATYAKDGTTDSEAAFSQAAAEATQSLVVAKRTPGMK